MIIPYLTILKSKFQETSHGISGQVNILIVIEETKTESNRPLGEGVDRAVGSRGTMKSGTA